MIQSLQLGNKEFPINIIQGPLAGISCAPFRALTWRYSRPAFSCTEMISCKTILQPVGTAYERFIKKAKEEGPVCFQLSGNDPEEVAIATQKVTEYGADLIDLNCGCPMQKIRSKGCGSSLLTNPTQLYQLMSALKKNTHVPVSIKIRVEGQSEEKFNKDLVSVIQDSSIDFLVVHGRHWTEDYSINCHYEQIQFFVEELKIPVIGNGDIRCLDSLKKMFATGCKGVMIGRAGVGQPWLIAKLIAEWNQQEFSLPSLKDIGFIFIEHVSQLMDLIKSEKQAVLQARKFGKYYARDVEDRLGFIHAMNKCADISTLRKICEDYFV